MVRLTTIWKSTHIRFKLKYNLYRSFILSILTYVCESWTLNANITKKILAFENKSHRKLLCITYKEGKTNIFVKNKINTLIGTFEPLLQTIRRRKLNGSVIPLDTIASLKPFCKEWLNNQEKEVGRNENI